MALACQIPLNCVKSLIVIFNKTESLSLHCDKIYFDKSTTDCLLFLEPMSMAISSALLNDLAPLEISFYLGLSSLGHDFMVRFLWLIKTKVKKRLLK